MFHPNVYADGSICLDILQNRWSPTYDVSSILTSIQSLLDEPNPNSPANSQAAQLYQENKREYEKRVTAIVEQSWVDVWAPLALYSFLSITLSSSSEYFSLSFLPHQEKTATISELSSATLKKKRNNKTTKSEWTLTCLPIHLRKTREGISILYLCFLSLILLFFYCMMWNKLLLTEFVIYLCCLVGLMLLVFEFYRFCFFFPFEIFPCFVMSAGVHTSWLFGKGWLMTNLAYFDDLIMSRKKNDREKKEAFRVGVVIILQVGHRCSW